MKNQLLKLICILVLCAFADSGFAQEKQIDSLQQLLKTVKEDTSKVNALNELSKKLNETGNADSSLLCSGAAKTLSEKLGFKKGTGNAFNNIAYVYTDQGDYTEALKNHRAALKIWEEIGNKRAAANSYNNIGLIFYYQDNYPEAIKNHSAALKIRNELSDKKGVANSYNNIGNVYYAQGSYPEALKNHLTALKLREEISDKRGIANSHNNIGNVYADQENYPEAIKNYKVALKIHEEMGNERDVASSYINIGSIFYEQANYPEALKNYSAALKIEEKLNDREGIAYCHTGLGLVYTGQGDYEESLKNHLESLKIWEELNDKNGMASSYVNLGVTYKNYKKYGPAEMYSLKALALTKEIGYPDGVKAANQCLSEIYSNTGRYELALESYKAYITARDSILNKENTRKIVQAQMLFEFDKKETDAKLKQEKKDVIAAEEKRKQQIIIIAVSVGLLLVLVLAGVILRSLRLNQRKNKIIEHQKTLVEEKHKEITDSINYAERIQRSFLATKELLDVNLKEYFVFFQPKDVVSGDFYWAGKLANNQFALVTADSTGHGVPGAIMSILNISSLEKAVERGIYEPAELLDHARRNIIERLKKDGSREGGKDGMDCSLVSFDFLNNTFTYAAANNPVWIVRENKILELAPDKMPVGKHDRDAVPFTQHTVNIQAGDMVYSLTDGMPDQFGGAKGKKFMYKQLKELLITVAHLPMAEQKQALLSSFENWKGNLEQIDDVCVIGVKIQQ